MKFSDIYGHKEAKADLLRMADTDCIPHTLLIEGRSGLGKMKLARAFVQYIHCENRHDGDSCGVCPSCRRSASLQDPDVYFSFPVLKKTPNKPVYSTDYMEEWEQMLHDSPEMDFRRWQLLIKAENKQPIIYADEADRISYYASISTFVHKEKIFVIWLPEKFHESTANKLLKVLEEPYRDTYFILVSNEPNLILETIRSRTRRLNLKPLKENEIADWLTQFRGISPDVAYTLAPMAEGSLLKASELAGGAGENEEFGEVFRNVMRSAYAVNMVGLKDLSEGITNYGREKIMRLLEYFGRMIRENFIFNLQYASLNRQTNEETQFSVRFSRFINERNVEDMIAETDKARGDIAGNANAKILLFDYLLKIALYLKR